MENEINKIIPEVINYFLLSSNSLFLFKSLRGLSTIKIISDKYSTKELMNLYSKKKANKEIDEMCLCYIIIVALSFKPYEEAKQNLKSLSKEKYIWAKELVELVLSCFKSFQVGHIVLEEQIEIQKVSIQKNTSTSLKIDKTHINKPLIQQYPDSFRNVIMDSTTNMTFEDKKNEN